MLFLRSHRHIFQGFPPQGGANAPPWLRQGGHKFFKGGGGVKYPDDDVHFCHNSTVDCF